MAATFITSVATDHVVVPAATVCVTNLTPATYDMGLNFYFFTDYTPDEEMVNPCPASEWTGRTPNQGSTCVDLGTWIEPQYLAQNYELLVQSMDPVDTHLVYDTYNAGYLKYAKGGQTVTYLCGDDSIKNPQKDLCCCIEGQDGSMCTWNANAVCQMPAFLQ